MLHTTDETCTNYLILSLFFQRPVFLLHPRLTPPPRESFQRRPEALESTAVTLQLQMLVVGHLDTPTILVDSRTTSSEDAPKEKEKQAKHLRDLVFSNIQSGVGVWLSAELNQVKHHRYTPLGSLLVG